jgi:HK97 family phage prohead protease
MSELRRCLYVDAPASITLEAGAVSEFGFVGYASVFGGVNSRGFGIDAGAFTKTLQENPTVPLLWQHTPDEPIGVIAEAQEDKRGLKVRGQLVGEVDRARSAYALLRAGAIRGLSIGFEVMQERQSPKDGTFFVTEARLHEVSLVTFPADPKATVSRVLSELAAYSAAGYDPAALAPIAAHLRAVQPSPDTAGTTQEHDYGADLRLLIITERLAALTAALRAL